MRATALISVLVSLAATLGGIRVASGQSPGATETATAYPATPGTATPTANATPTSTAPATPPEYDGRPCESGTLIIDFVVLGDREPVPSCVQPFAADGSKVLYGLSPVPAGLRLRGVTEHTTNAGVRIVSVVYETAGGPPPFGPPAGRALVTISLQTEALSKPYPVHVLLKFTASAAAFLPTAGLLLEPAAASQVGLWFGPSGLYTLDVDQSVPGVPLEIQQLAALLTPIDVSATPSPPGPPATGSGQSGSPGRPPSVAVLTASIVAAGLAGFAVAWRAARRGRTSRRPG